MHWIQHNNGTIERGEAAPPAGDLFFVDEVGSRAVVNGKLYIDGISAPSGRHEIQFKNGDVLPIDVDAKGKVTRRQIVKGGGKVV